LSPILRSCGGGRSLWRQPRRYFLPANLSVSPRSAHSPGRRPTVSGFANYRMGRRKESLRTRDCVRRAFHLRESGSHIRTPAADSPLFEPAAAIARTCKVKRVSGCRGKTGWQPCTVGMWPYLVLRMAGRLRSFCGRTPVCLSPARADNVSFPCESTSGRRTRMVSIRRPRSFIRRRSAARQIASLAFQRRRHCAVRLDA
jgi:hypothetical protein